MRMPKKAKAKVAKDMPPATQDDITVVYSKNEVLSLAQILLFSKNVFAEMSVNFLKEGNPADAETMNARSLLSQHLLAKIQTIEEMGEPESRQVH
jgi:hypothetical protein